MAKNLYKYTWIVALWSITIFSGRTAATQQQNPKHTTNPNLHTLQICNATDPRPISRATSSHNWIILSAYLHTLWLYPVWLKLFSSFPPGSPQLPEILFCRAWISQNSRIAFFFIPGCPRSPEILIFLTQISPTSRRPDFPYPDLSNLQKFWFSPPRSPQPSGILIFCSQISPPSRNHDFFYPDFANLQKSWFSLSRFSQPPEILLFLTLISQPPEILISFTRISPTSRNLWFAYPDFPNLQKSQFFFNLP